MLRSFLAIGLALTCWAAAALAAEKDEAGFVSLFNGKDLDGWVVMGKPEGFAVVEGTIRSEGAKGGEWLRTEKKYGDYILKLEWRVSEGGNSGVFIRCDKEGKPWLTGYEVQILNAPRDIEHCTGSLYGYAAVLERPDDSPGKWHTFEIQCRGPQVAIFSDGRKCTEFDQSKSEAAKEKPIKGYIGLQDSHSAAGHVIEFRNIRIKPLGE